MCGRFYLHTLPEHIVAQFEIVGLPDKTLDPESIKGNPERERAASALGPRYNIAPGQHIAVVRRRRGDTELAAPRWGLIPFWSNDDSMAYKTINARSETAHEKPAFRDAFAKRRCLVPADGFYEWKQGPAGKQPLAVSVENERGRPAVYAMAGLWETWRDPSIDADLETATILTCAANPALAEIHPRMPVILPREAWTAWLDERTSIDDARRLCTPYTASAMPSRPVSTRVNSVRNDDPSLLDDAIDESKGLFGM
ncbi:MAG: SOS response-associated peptidase [Planctomycetota bacterium]